MWFRLRYVDILMCLWLPEGCLMGLNELLATYVLLCRAVSLIPVIPVISNASQEPCRYNAFLTRRQAAFCSASRFLLSFYFTPSLLGRRVWRKEIHTFILSFFSFTPFVPEHSCRWDSIPGLCLGSGRALRCLMMGLARQHLSFLLWETGRGNLKCAIMCCYNLTTQFLKEIGLHTNTSTYQQTLTGPSVKKANSLTHSIAGGMQV